jgi:hypothetical protein
MKTMLPRGYDGVFNPATHFERPVVALDIDGTMGAYHSHFWRMACAYTGRDLPNPESWDGTCSFYQHLGISKATYRRIKLAYRQGGYKRSMPVYEGVSYMSRRLREEGAVVAICTTRPYLQLEVVDADTRHWLTKRAKVQFDCIISGEHKYRDLVSMFGKDRIVAVYEDLPEQAKVCEDLGIPLFLKDKPYNQGGYLSVSYSFGYRVHSAQEFLVSALTEMYDYKEKHS